MHRKSGHDDRDKMDRRSNREETCQYYLEACKDCDV